MSKINWNRIILILFVIFPQLALAKQSYDFSAEFGIGYYEFNSAAPDTFAAETIIPVFKRFYQLSSQALIKIYSYNEISPDRYIVYSYIRDDTNVIGEIEYASEGRQEKSAAANKNTDIFLSIVDLKDQSVIRLQRKNKPLNNLLSEFSPSIEVYGCLQGYPTILADVNDDGATDVLFIGGGGSVYIDEEINARTELVVFLGPDYKEDVLRIDLHQEHFYFYFDQSGARYQVTRDQVGQRISDLSQSGIFVRGTAENLRPGYRHFSKLYFGDFNDKKIQSLLVWRRFYLSRKKSDPEKGFDFEKEEFELYDFVNSSIERKSIGIEQAHNILKKNQLQWSTGFPNRSMCYGRKDKSYPLIMDYDHPELKINDPALSN